LATENDGQRKAAAFTRAAAWAFARERRILRRDAGSVAQQISIRNAVFHWF